jgi:hypothetical protein
MDARLKVLKKRMASLDAVEQNTQIFSPTGNQTLIPGYPVQWVEL